jgi:hypothetical protein
MDVTGQLYISATLSCLDASWTAELVFPFSKKKKKKKNDWSFRESNLESPVAQLVAFLLYPVIPVLDVDFYRFSEF